ncbi:MAG: hypothetical protein LBF04_07075 [Prevotellaceae bacterium]|jgi:hypothetical protein|nr:hypothetical protein [Prevotellaceae bacterium]
MNIKKILLSVCLLLIGSSVFAQSKDIIKMYNQIDSLENRLLELKRENDAAVLRCLDNKEWISGTKGCAEAYGLRVQGSDRLYGSNYYELRTYDGTLAMNYAQQVCECMVGKKHEIEAVETAIKQIERRIELLKYDNKPTQNTKK